jgi:hypothetical protein
MESSSLLHQCKGPRREAPLDDSLALEADGGLVLTVDGVEVRPAVFTEVHVDQDSVEGRNAGHLITSSSATDEPTGTDRTGVCGRRRR